VREATRLYDDVEAGWRKQIARDRTLASPWPCRNDAGGNRINR
jgi:hypothetical protein